MAQQRILVVEDDTSNRAIISLILEDEFFAVTQATNDGDAVLLADQAPPDLVILDMHWRGTSALSVAHHLKEHHPATAILAVSTLPARLPLLPHPDFAAVLAKPFAIDDLLDIVRRLHPSIHPTNLLPLP